MESVAIEGYLEKQGMMKFIWKKFWFCLDGHILSYYKDDTKKLPVLGTIDLSKSQTVKKLSNPSHAYDFEVLTRTKTVVLAAFSSSECNSWVQKLQEAMLYKNRSSALLSQPSVKQSYKKQSIVERAWAIMFGKETSISDEDTYDDIKQPSNNDEGLYCEASDNIFYDTKNDNPNPAESKRQAKPFVPPRRSLKSSKSSTSGPLQKQHSLPGTPEECYAEVNVTNNLSKGKIMQKVAVIDDEYGGIYDTIQENLIENESNCEEQDFDQQYDTILDSSVLASNKKSAKTRKEEANSGEKYDAINFKNGSMNLVHTGTGYSKVCTEQRSVESEDTDLDDIYDEIAQLVERKPTLNSQHGYLDYSAAFKEMKEFLDNNQTAYNSCVLASGESSYAGVAITELKDFLQTLG